MGTNTVASMVVFEGGAPKKSDYRRFKVRAALERAPGDAAPDDFAAMEEVLGRRYARWEHQRDVSPHDKEYDPSFAALPNLVVIDGGKGQLSAGLRALRGFRERGVVVVSLAKRIEEVFIPGRAAPLRAARTTPPSCSCSSACATRRTGSRSPTTASGATRAMTASILDELPGVGPARKRALLTHFGSPDAILAASREELEAVPGLSGKLARELYRELHKTGVLGLRSRSAAASASRRSPAGRRSCTRRGMRWSCPVCIAPGSVPVVVSGRTSARRASSPEVELADGAWSHSTVAGAGCPAAVTCTCWPVLSDLLISTTRVRPSGACVAQTLTGPPGAVTGSSCAPGGNAWANISIP